MYVSHSSPTIEFFCPRGLEVDIDTFDIAFHFTNEQSVDGTLCSSTLHLGFELVLQHTVEFLYIVLHE